MTTSLDTVAHVVQLALTPIFLLSGVATLLNVFSTRLGRVADRVDHLAGVDPATGPAESAEREAQLAYLRARSLLLDVAVVLAAFAGVATCACALTLFVGALRERASAWMLFSTFGFAIVCTIGALCVFMLEMLMASRGLRAASRARAPRSRAPHSSEG